MRKYKKEFPEWLIEYLECFGLVEGEIVTVLKILEGNPEIMGMLRAKKLNGTAKNVIWDKARIAMVMYFDTVNPFHPLADELRNRLPKKKIVVSDGEKHPKGLRPVNICQRSNNRVVDSGYLIEVRREMDSKGERWIDRAHVELNNGTLMIYCISRSSIYRIDFTDRKVTK